MMNNLYNEYLMGDKFSNSFKFKWTFDTSKIDLRIDKILELVKDKNVVHLGFCDHLPLIDYKIENGYWLHNKLIDHCKTCIGIDIDKKAIEYIKNKYEIDDIYEYNILSDEKLECIDNQEFDYLVLGEILEHINNPIQFLEAIRLKYASNFQKIIISVPNAFSYNNIKNALKSNEQLNTDHKFWFTPFTLSKVITVSGFKVKNIYMTQYYDGNGPLKKIMYKKFPLLRNGIVLEAETK